MGKEVEVMVTGVWEEMMEKAQKNMDSDQEERETTIIPINWPEITRNQAISWMITVSQNLGDCKNCYFSCFTLNIIHIIHRPTVLTCLVSTVRPLMINLTTLFA